MSPGSSVDRVTVAIVTPLEPELVAAIAAVDARLDVLFAPELLPAPRYPSDHRGEQGFARDAEDGRRWQAMLREADVLFGIPGDTPSGLRDAVGSNLALRWVQATAAGAGEQVRAAQLTREELDRVTITSASGVHATPLAEFAIFGLLAFARDLPRLLADQHDHQWSHYPVAELRDRTLLILGLGKIGDEVARLAAALGMRVNAINRTATSASPDVQTVHPPEALGELLGDADAVVITLPLTDETRGLIDADAIAAMKPGATLVNVGRGGVIDEPALISALQEERLAGAALDVYATEPLPDDSPLWDLPNALLSPHTAALSPRENERIVELFTENLRRYLVGGELISVVNPEQFY